MVCFSSPNETRVLPRPPVECLEGRVDEIRHRMMVAAYSGPNRDHVEEILDTVIAILHWACSEQRFHLVFRESALKAEFRNLSDQIRSLIPNLKLARSRAEHPAFRPSVFIGSDTGINIAAEVSELVPSLMAVAVSIECAAQDLEFVRNYDQEQNEDNFEVWYELILWLLDCWYFVKCDYKKEIDPDEVMLGDAELDAFAFIETCLTPIFLDAQLRLPPLPVDTLGHAVSSYIESNSDEVKRLPENPAQGEVD